MTEDAPLGWVVPGPLNQVTGGYLYDARIVDGLRARGWPVGVLDIRSRVWPLDPAAGQRLVRGLVRERWRAVVLDELAHPAVAAALLGGRLRQALGSAPLVVLVHHLRWSEPGPWPLRRLAEIVERPVLRAADLVICTSATTARTVRPFVRQETPVEVVRPGWDTHGGPGPQFSPPAARPPAGEGRRERRSAGLRALLVAHWTPRKGVLEALRAVRLAPADVTLDLVGETDRDRAYADRVRALLADPALADRVQVHGRVSDADLAHLYQSADVLLLASTHEGYGMVLAEALAAGLPIVATRVGAVPEVVRDGREATLVAAGDVAGMAQALERLATDPDERARRAALARERAASLPSWSDSVAAFADVLTKALSPRG